MKIIAALSRSPDSPFILESVELDEPRPDAEGVVVGDPVASRHGKAVELGATQSVDPTTEDVATVVRGATHALDTTALPEVVATALGVLESRGMLVVADSRSGGAIKPVLVW
jgi:Zn-dependent alcohol dehydrogenase